jgi:hypothetical protein
LVSQAKPSHPVPQQLPLPGTRTTPPTGGAHERVQASGLLVNPLLTMPWYSLYLPQRQLYLALTTHRRDRQGQDRWTPHLEHASVYFGLKYARPALKRRLARHPQLTLVKLDRLPDRPRRNQRKTTDEQEVPTTR